MELSHHEALKQENIPGFLKMQNLKIWDFNNAIIGREQFKLSSNFLNISNRNEQEELNSYTVFDNSSIPQFVDFKFNRLYNHTIKGIYLYLKYAISADNTMCIPMISMINKIEITRSNSQILQTITQHDIWFYNKLLTNPSKLDVGTLNKYYQQSLNNNGDSVETYILLPTIFNNNVFLSKFKGDDIFLRVYFRQRSEKLVTAASINQDSTKISLSDCKLYFDLNEIDSDIDNKLQKNEFLDYVLCIPETYNIYSNMT